MNATCWADPLSREERAELARKLASACKRFWDDRHAVELSSAGEAASCIKASVEMSDLHLDVTVRAEVVR